MWETFMATKVATIPGIVFRLTLGAIGTALVAYFLVGPGFLSKGGAIALAMVLVPIIIGVIFRQYRLRKALSVRERP